MSYNRGSTGTDSVTGFAQRDRILHFEMCVIQRSIFLQWHASSVSNMGIYGADGAAAMMQKRSLKDYHLGVKRLSSQDLQSWWVFQKMVLLRRHLRYLWKGERLRLLVWDGFSWRIEFVLYKRDVDVPGLSQDVPHGILWTSSHPRTLVGLSKDVPTLVGNTGHECCTKNYSTVVNYCGNMIVWKLSKLKLPG